MPFIRNLRRARVVLAVLVVRSFGHRGVVGTSFVDSGSLRRVRSDMVISLDPRVIGASSVVILFVGELFIVSSSSCPSVAVQTFIRSSWPRLCVSMQSL